MKTVFEHIAHIKGKPHHVRKRVAFAAAANGAGIIALVWIVGSLSAGAFAIQGSTFAESTGAESAATIAADNGSNSTDGRIAGAAAALTDVSAPARIEILNAAPAPRMKQAEQTTIPF